MANEKNFRGRLNLDVNQPKEALGGLTDEIKKSIREGSNFRRVLGEMMEPIDAGAGIVGNLARALGSRDLGLAAQLTQATLAGARMGATFGPGGVVVGGLIAAIAQTAGLREEIARTIAQIERLEGTSNDINHRLLTMAETIGEVSDEDLAGLMEEATTQLGELRHALNELNSTPIIGILPGELEERAEAASHLRDQIDTLSSRIENLSSVANNAGSDLRDMTNTDPELSLNPVLARIEAENAEAPTRRGGGGPREQRRNARVSREAESLISTMSNQGASTENELATREAIRLATLENILILDAEIAEAETARLEQLVDIKEATDRETEAIDNKTRALAEQAQVVAEAMAEMGSARMEFNESTTGSVDDVIESYNAMVLAERRAGQTTTDVGAGMEAAMASVGNTALEQIGDGVSKAFAKSISAAIKGQESFDKIMGEMVAGVLESLLQESIVQAIREGALAISDFASYRYDSGAMHLAAAGAWAAVGVASGVGMAALGSATGGAGGGAGATPTMTPAPSQAESEPSGQGSTYNIYYSNPSFQTEEEQIRFMEMQQRRTGRAA